MLKSKSLFRFITHKNEWFAQKSEKKQIPNSVFYDTVLYKPDIFLCFCLAAAFIKDNYFMVFYSIYDMWPFICCCVVAAAAAPLLGGF